MRKRLMVGVIAGGLLAAMLPGVAQAGPDPLKEGPRFSVSIGCDLEGGGTLLFSTVGPAGWAQSSVRWAFENDPDRDDCIPNTKTTTITKVQLP